MNLILLSGGSGKRLWPLSNEVRSKQFLKIFKKNDGSHESMVQRMYRMITEVDKEAKVTIATSNNQVALIRGQLGEKVGISVEPCRRDTFPAIALAVSYLHDIESVSRNEVVAVCPVDPYIESDYFIMIEKLCNIAKITDYNLALMGIDPTFPSEKYGYIIPETDSMVSSVKAFKEKPNPKQAKEYISQGALWNSGVFAFKLDYVLGIAEERFGTRSYKELFEKYNTLEKISFDYAVVEKEKKIQVVRYHGMWKDLGTWDTLTEAMSEDVSGNAIAVDCNRTHVINELHIPLIALGANNMVIAATPDGLLVADKDKSDRLKDYVIENRPMVEKRIWGEYEVLDYRIQSDGNNSLTKHLVISEGKHISYQRHQFRSELWTIVDGYGEVIIDGIVKSVKRGDYVFIEPGKKHAIKATTELHIIEVQIGTELSEEDIERLDWNWESN